MAAAEAKSTGMSAVVRYTIVAIVLGIFTAIEVAVLYPPLVAKGEWFKIGLLLVLSVAKFIFVVALFMHLWHDPPLYTFIFTVGFVLALGTGVALKAIFPKAVDPLQPIPGKIHQPGHEESVEEGHGFRFVEDGVLVS